MTNFIYSTSIDWMLLKPVTVLDDAVVTKTNEKTPTRKLQCREGEREQHPSNQQNIRQSEGATREIWKVRKFPVGDVLKKDWHLSRTYNIELK